MQKKTIFFLFTINIMSLKIIILLFSYIYTFRLTLTEKKRRWELVEKYLGLVIQQHQKKIAIFLEIK
jgi:hypothetical protein